MKQFVINQVPNVGDVYVPPKAICTQGLLEEVNLFSCSPLAVKEWGGIHTRNILHQLEEKFHFSIDRCMREGMKPVVDVRIHRLFAEQYPAIPGWHCDHVPRGGYSGQPNFSLCAMHAFNVALIISDHPQGVSNTEFVMQPVRISLEDQDHVYRELHREVQRIKPLVAPVPDGKFVWFSQRSIHRAAPAARRGVRLFFRYSMMEKPHIQNVKHSMPHVYQLSEENGW